MASKCAGTVGEDSILLVRNGVKKFARQSCSGSPWAKALVRLKVPDLVQSRSGHSTKSAVERAARDEICLSQPWGIMTAVLAALVLARQR